MGNSVEVPNMKLVLDQSKRTVKASIEIPKIDTYPAFKKEIYSTRFCLTFIVKEKIQIGSMG